MDAGHLNQIFTMPHQRANLADGVLGTKRGFQQTHRMQILKPLAIQNVGLSARDMMHMLSIDQMNFNAASLQDLEQRDPIDTRRLHGDRVDSALLQPVDEGVEVRSKCRKRSYGFGIAIGGYRHDSLCGSHIDTRGIGSHHWQTSLHLSMLPLPLLRHRSSPFTKSAT